MSAAGERLHPARMKAFYVIAAALFFAAVSCERHDWEETKVLHETHGHHGGDDEEADH